MLVATRRAIARTAPAATVLRQPRAALRGRAAVPMLPTVPERRGSFLEAWLSSFDNARVGIVRLNPEVWGQPLRPDIVHTTLVWARACQRAGTAKAKGKGEVSGTGKKPFAQKGRGRARHGSLRSPQFVGGGVAHPPRPRDFSYTLPKKVKALALKVALSDKYRSGQLVLVQSYALAEAKAKLLHAALADGGLGLRVGTQRALLLHGGAAERGAAGENVQDTVERAASNLPKVLARAADKVNLQDVISHSLVVASLPALEALEQRLAKERRHALAVPPAMAIAGRDGAEGVRAPVDRDGLCRAIVRPLPAGVARVGLAPEGEEALPWAAVDVRAMRLVQVPPRQLEAGGQAQSQ